MMSCPDFEPGTPLSPTPGSRRCKSLRIGDGITAIPWPWVYEGSYCDIIESCLMSPCIGADWGSIF